MWQLQANICVSGLCHRPNIWLVHSPSCATCTLIMSYTNFMLLLPCVFSVSIHNQQIHLIKHNSWTIHKLLHVLVPGCHLWGVFCSNVIQVQQTKLGIVLHLLEGWKYYHSKLHKVEKYKIMKLQFCDIKIMWYWASSCAGSQPFIFCMQYTYEHLSWSVWSEDITSRWSVWSLSCWAV